MSGRPKNIIGEKFGKLTARRLTGRIDDKGYAVWLCECECGGTIEQSLHDLAQKKLTGKCQECRGQKLGGEKFGMLTARYYTGDGKWLCECECGRTVLKTSHQLTSGKYALNCGRHKKYHRRQSTRGSHLPPESLKRRDRMAEMLASGMNKNEIAKEFGLSRERVGQILATLPPT